jgi:hypothetical protein
MPSGMRPPPNLSATKRQVKRPGRRRARAVLGRPRASVIETGPMRGSCSGRKMLDRRSQDVGALTKHAVSWMMLTAYRPIDAHPRRPDVQSRAEAQPVFRTFWNYHPGTNLKILNRQSFPSTPC